MVHGILLRANYKWVTLTCTNSNCKAKAKAHLWHCECGILWRSCTIHSTWDTHAKLLCFNTRSVRNQPSQAHVFPPVLPAKRKSCTQPHSSSSGTACNVQEKGRKRNDPTPILSPAALLAKAPRLAAKFPHLVGNLILGSGISVKAPLGPTPPTKGCFD